MKEISRHKQILVIIEAKAHWTTYQALPYHHWNVTVHIRARLKGILLLLIIINEINHYTINTWK